MKALAFAFAQYVRLRLARMFLRWSCSLSDGIKLEPPSRWGTARVLMRVLHVGAVCVATWLALDAIRDWLGMPSAICAALALLAVAVSRLA